MRIPVRCECGHEWSVQHTRAGRTIDCPMCARSVAVAAPASQPDEEDAHPAGVEALGPTLEQAFGQQPQQGFGDEIDLSAEEDIPWWFYAAGGGAIAFIFLIFIVILIAMSGRGGSDYDTGSGGSYAAAPPPSMGTGLEGDGTGSGDSGVGRGSFDYGSGTGAEFHEDDIDQEATDSTPTGIEALDPEEAPEEPVEVPLVDGLVLPDDIVPPSQSSSVFGTGMFGARGKSGKGLRRAGMTDASQLAVRRGLAWLAKVQEVNGRWDGAKWDGNAGDIGVTCLAVLAFLADGHTHVDEESQYRDNVNRAINYILSQEHYEEGSPTRNRPGRFWNSSLYEQGLVVWALAEAYSMTGDEKLIEPAQRGIDHIIARMGDHGGFEYSGPGHDMSVTGFQIMAYKSAVVAELNVPEGTTERLLGFVDSMTQSDGSVAYRPGRVGTPGMTAVGLFCRFFLGQEPTEDAIRDAANFIAKKGVDLDDEYYTYYGTYGMYQMGGRFWPAWNGRVRDPVIRRQRTDDPKLHGSWDPSSKWAKQGGRVYSTAMYLLTLEVYYRYLPVYR